MLVHTLETTASNTHFGRGLMDKTDTSGRPCFKTGWGASPRKPLAVGRAQSPSLSSQKPLSGQPLSTWIFLLFSFLLTRTLSAKEQGSLCFRHCCSPRASSSAGICNCSGLPPGHRLLGSQCLWPEMPTSCPVPSLLPEAFLNLLTPKAGGARGLLFAEALCFFRFSHCW